LYRYTEAAVMVVTARNQEDDAIASWVGLLDTTLHVTLFCSRQNAVQLMTAGVFSVTNQTSDTPRE
jgi:hypothetical protein